MIGFTVVYVSADHRRSRLALFDADDIDHAAEQGIDAAERDEFVAGVVQTDLRGRIIDGNHVG